MSKEHIRALQKLIKEEWLKLLASKASFEAALNRIGGYKTEQLDRLIRDGKLNLYQLPKYSSKILYLGTIHSLYSQDAITVTVYFISDPLRLAKERTKRERELISKYEEIVKSNNIEITPPEGWRTKHILKEIQALNEELRFLKNGHKLIYPMDFHFRIDELLDDGFIEEGISIKDEDFDELLRQ